jgi:uncharacterized protein
MENRNSWASSARIPFERARCLSLSIAAAIQYLAKDRVQNRAGARDFLALLFVLSIVLVGCGAPGDPVAPSPPVPTPVIDLSARQAGDGVELTFSMPTKTVRGARLTEAPAIEVLRGAPKPDGSPNLKSLVVVETIPGELTAKFQSDDRVQVVTPVAPSDNRAATGSTFVYAIRTRASRKRTSTDSNPVTVHVYPVPADVGQVSAKVTESSIDLTWPPVTRTSGGDPITVNEYHVYRGELDPRRYDPNASASTADILREKFLTPLALLNRADGAEYRDTQFDFGKLYIYVVRSVTTVAGNPLESNDSDPLVLKTVDTYPPHTPTGLVATMLENPAGATPSIEIDLSWSISTDKGEPLAQDLLLSPAYRDTSVQSGHRYWYSVTAVDRSSNESAPTPQVAADVAQHTP